MADKLEGSEYESHIKKIQSKLDRIFYKEGTYVVKALEDRKVTIVLNSGNSIEAYYFRTEHLSFGEANLEYVSRSRLNLDKMRKGEATPKDGSIPFYDIKDVESGWKE